MLKRRVKSLRRLHQTHSHPLSPVPLPVLSSPATLPNYTLLMPPGGVGQLPHPNVWPQAVQRNLRHQIKALQLHCQQSLTTTSFQTLLTTAVNWSNSIFTPHY